MTKTWMMPPRRAGKSYAPTMARAMAAAMAAAPDAEGDVITTIGNHPYEPGDLVRVVTGAQQGVFRVTDEGLKPAGNRHQRRAAAAKRRKLA